MCPFLSLASSDLLVGKRDGDKKVLSWLVGDEYSANLGGPRLPHPAITGSVAGGPRDVIDILSGATGNPRPLIARHY